MVVAGAGGFIGQHLCRILMELQAKVVAVDSHAPDPAEVLSRLLKVDLAATDEIRALDGVDPTAVFHLAAAGASDPLLSVEDALRVNVLGTVNHAAGSGWTRTGSGGAYGCRAQSEQPICSQESGGLGFLLYVCSH